MLVNLTCPTEATNGTVYSCRNERTKKFHYIDNMGDTVSDLFSLMIDEHSDHDEDSNNDNNNNNDDNNLNCIKLWFSRCLFI